MEYLMEQHLNECKEEWTLWQADEEMLYCILSGQSVPPQEDIQVGAKEETLFPLAA